MTNIIYAYDNLGYRIILKKIIIYALLRITAKAKNK
jgi:hypothetical protein